MILRENKMKETGKDTELDKKLEEMMQSSENDFDMSESDSDDDEEDLDFMIYRINTNQDPNQVLRYRFNPDTNSLEIYLD